MDSLGSFKLVTYYNITPNRYYVNEYGIVFDSWTGRYKVPYQHTKTKYWYVRLHNIFLPVWDHVALHRLVAWEYCSGRDPYLDVNHKDGNKSNNHYTNLEWCTRQYNIIHSVRNGLAGKGDHRGTLNGQAKLSEDDVRNICQLIQDTDLSNREILNKLNLDVSINQPRRIRNKKNWNHISKDYDF